VRNLLRSLVTRHAAFVALSSLFLAAFQYLICAAVASVDVSGALETLLESLPPMLQSMLSATLFGGFSVHGLLAFGWNHPIAQALGAALAIVLAAHAVAGEAETGAIELLLSQPLSRGRYFVAQAGFAFAALALLSLAGIGGTLLGQRVFQVEPFATAALVRLGWDYLLLQCAWFGITLLFSAFGREGGRVASAGFLVALASYIVQVIGQLWDRAAFLAPYTLQHYYQPQDILVKGEGIAKPVGVLLGVALMTTAAAWWRFRTRDLP
jgi:ABC-type transport system involved in multi-copper enzyme maturation permease subunit